MHHFFESIRGVFDEENRKALLLGVFTSIVLFCVLSPRVHFEVGNTFFGKSPALYNVTLAQYFFQYASYPLLGEPAPWAHYQLSRTYFIQGNLHRALTEAQLELESYPENVRTYYIMGLTLGYMHREEEAIEAFGTFIEHYPLSWAARNDRAWLQFRIDDVDGALATLAPVTQFVANPWVQNTYGVLLMNTGDFAEAKKALTFAEERVATMTEAEWGAAYPGNDPRIYEVGLRGMRTSIAENIRILTEKGF